MNVGLIALSALTALLAGCAVTAGNTTGSSDVADAALVSAVRQRTSWSVNGALGLTERADGVDENIAPLQSVTATMQWRERGDALGVVLRGPLGIGEMVLQASASGATLKRGTSNLVGRNADTLVQQALNLAVPVPFRELSNWMRGLPGAADSVTYDGVGRLQSLRYQDGTGVNWQAKIRRYVSVDGLQMPSLITAVGGPYEIRLALKNWRFDPLNSDETPFYNDNEGRLSIPGRSS